MIFDLLAPPQGPRRGGGGDPKNPNLVEFRKKIIMRNVMVFDLLAPPQGPRGGGGAKNCAIACVIHVSNWLNFGKNFGPGPQKKCAVARPIYVSNSNTKFGWISSNGSGGDSLTYERRRLQYPHRFFKKAWG